MKKHGELQAIARMLMWMMATFIFAIFLLAVLSACLEKAYAAQPTEDEIVEQTFTAWRDKCKKCHGNGDAATEFGITSGAPASLFHTAGEKELKEIISFIRDGHKTVPPFEELSEEEIAILSRFIKLGNMLQKLESNTNEIKPLLRARTIGGKRVLEL